MEKGRCFKILRNIIKRNHEYNDSYESTISLAAKRRRTQSKPSRGTKSPETFEPMIVEESPSVIKSPAIKSKVVVVNRSKEPIISPPTMKVSLPKTTGPRIVAERSSNLIEGHSKKVWIIGSSYIKRGEDAAENLFGSNLGLKADVCWFGKGVMRWEAVLPRFYAELSTKSPPDILVVHAGGHNLGVINANNLASTIKHDLMKLNKDFPGMKIIFSSINERRWWKYGQQTENVRDLKTVNDLIKKDAESFNGDIIEHSQLRYFKKSLFNSDGVHFSAEGNRHFLGSIRSTLEKILGGGKVSERKQIGWP